jgi:elongation factor G
MQAKLKTEPLVLQLPMESESAFEGVVDLLSMREIRWDQNDMGVSFFFSDIADKRKEEALTYHEQLIETVSAFSDEIAELYLEGKDVPPALIKTAVRAGTLARKFTPVLCGASLRNIGVQPLLDAVVDFLPAPDELPPIQGIQIKNNQPVSVACQTDAPPLALVFKIQTEKEAGMLSYIRMYSGVLKKGEAVYNLNKKKRERIHRLLRMHSNRSTQLDEIKAGDIAVVVGFKLAQTGDTIGSEGFQIALERIKFPEPVISVAIEPKTLSESDKLKDTLELLTKEDPTFTVKENEDTGQLIISGMGELHLEVLVTRLLDDYKIQAKVGKPQVSYHESISKAAQYTEKYHKVLAGKENTAEITLRVAPRERGRGNGFTSRIGTDKLPQEMIDAVARGVRNSMEAGASYGYPTIDIGVELIAAVYNPATASVLAYEAAGAIGFDNACGRAEPILLEPIMTVDVFTPKEFIGDVIGNLNSRGGNIVSITSKATIEHVQASVALNKMFGYSTALRSITQGRATFAMEFSHFAKKIT